MNQWFDFSRFYYGVSCWFSWLPSTSSFLFRGTFFCCVSPTGSIAANNITHAAHSILEGGFVFVIGAFVGARH